MSTVGKVVTVFAALALCLLATLPTAKVEAVEGVDFEAEVWPFLETKCVQCHGTKEKFSNLRLDSPDAIMKGGDLGDVVVPGEPDDSPLYARAALPSDDLDFMPVEGDGLTEDELETLKLWIEQGAEFGAWAGAGG